MTDCYLFRGKRTDNSVWVEEICQPDKYVITQLFETYDIVYLEKLIERKDSRICGNEGSEPHVTTDQMTPEEHAMVTGIPPCKHKTNFDVWRDALTVERFIDLFSDSDCYICPARHQCSDNGRTCTDEITDWANAPCTLALEAFIETFLSAP